MNGPRRRAMVLLAALALPAARADIHTRTDPGGLVVISNVAPSAPVPAPVAPAPRARARHAAPAVAPASFPRVDPAEQRARDAGRRAILEEELAAERQALGAARGAKAAPDQLRRHQLNIDALRRELLTVR